MLRRRDFFTNIMAGTAVAQLGRAQQEPRFPADLHDLTGADVFVERPATGMPHKGKVLLAFTPHSDDIPELAAGTVAKLIEEGYTGYLVRATNDDMGDDAGLGTPGTIGENVLSNERDTAEVARILGCKGVFNLNYSNHRMGDVSLNELICRLIFLIRVLKVDTVVSYDPWQHDEENPDHYIFARGVEAACWMAGRAHDYEEQFAGGLEPHAVREKYYYMRRAYFWHPETNRVVDISGVFDKKIEANRANRAKGPAGHLGSRLRAALAKKNQRLPVLGDDDVSADRNYIKIQLNYNRLLGKQYGVEYAEAFHYIGAYPARIDDYIKQNAVPLK